MALRSVLWRVKDHYDHAHLRCDTSDECVELGRWLQARGFRVGEHEAFGGVTIRHSATGGHHDNPSTAIDVNFGPAGENEIEKRAFDALIPSVLHPGLDLRQLKGDPPRPQEDELTPELRQYLDLQFEAVKLRLNELEGNVEDKRVQGISRVARKVEEVRDLVQRYLSR